MDTKDDTILSTRTETTEDVDLSTRTETNASASSSSSTTAGSRTLPRCARCRNHELEILLKGHKRYCRYRKCKCRKCKLTVIRQREMAKNTMRKRAQVQDANKIRAADEPTRSVEEEPISKHGGNGLHAGLGGDITNPASRKVTSSHPNIGAPSSLPQYQFSGSAEILLLYTSKLMESLGCPWVILPYMYAILKYANGNLEEALNCIRQAHFEIRTMRFWNDFGMVTPSQYCCTGYTSPTEAPTYEGHVPYIGVTPSTSAIDLGLHPHTLNSHIPATRVPFVLESLQEHSPSLDRLPTSP